MTCSKAHTLDTNRPEETNQPRYCDLYVEHLPQSKGLNAWFPDGYEPLRTWSLVE